MNLLILQVFFSMPAENVIWLKFILREKIHWSSEKSIRKATQKSHETSIEWDENCYFSFFIAMLVTERWSKLEIQEETVEKFLWEQK